MKLLPEKQQNQKNDLPLEDTGWLRTTIGVWGEEIMDGIWLWSATIVITFCKEWKKAYVTCFSYTE